MKKIIRICLCCLAAAALVSGCSGKKEGVNASVSSGASDRVTLGQYKGVTYTPLSVEVTDEEVEAEIQAFLDANPTMKEVDRAAAEGDVVNIDYVGMKDGEAFEGGTSEGYDLKLGSGSFIDGFEDGLIGAVKGQELSLNLTFPENYGSKELAGQDVVFDVTVNSVQEVIPAVLDDEFVRAHTEYDTVDAYREGTREDLENVAVRTAENQKESDVFLKVVSEATVELTEEEIQAVYEEQYATYEKQAAMYGIDMDTLMSLYGMGKEDFEAALMTQAEEAAKQQAVVEAIAAAENIKVSDEDRRGLAEDFAYESAEAMIEKVGADIVDKYLISRKVLDFLAENAVAEE